VPFVVGAWFRVGVRLAAAGDDDVVLAAVSRRGVPAAGGLVAAAVDIVCLCVYCFSLWVWSRPVEAVIATAPSRPSGAPRSKFRAR
jgi:hypothetical protein